jgi:hypothetical protein
MALSMLSASPASLPITTWGNTEGFISTADTTCRLTDLTKSVTDARSLLAAHEDSAIFDKGILGTELLIVVKGLLLVNPVTKRLEQKDRFAQKTIKDGRIQVM